MKRFYAILLLLLSVGNFALAQVQVRKATPADLQAQGKFKTQKAPPAAIRLKEINVAALLEEDKRESEQGLPPRFGKAVAVSLSTTSAGSWETVENGTVWKLGITSSGAYSLNFFFDRFYLAPGAELYVYNEDRSIIMGPITADRTDKSGVYATDLLPGSTALFELFEPAAVTGQSRLHLARVVHGYKNMFPAEYAGNGFGQSASCNVDIILKRKWFPYSKSYLDSASAKLWNLNVILFFNSSLKYDRLSKKLLIACLNSPNVL